MNIGTVAEKAGVPPKTIRYYEDIGLIRKAERLPNGYRAYSAREMRELNFIKRARDLGFSVEEVRDLLDLWRNTRRTSAAVKALVSRHLAMLDHKIAELESMRRSLAQLVERCQGDERPECPILDDLERAPRRRRK
jgi:MerR family copper efflux transcriptional regulator